MNLLAYDQTKYIYRDIRRPTFAGSTGEYHPNTVVRITLGQKQVNADYNPVDGKFTWTLDEDLPDGVYNLSIIVIDAAGNVGPATLRTLVIDTTPPEAPELINLKDDVGAKTGSFDPGQLTDDAKPTLTGVAQPNTVVYLRDAAGNDIGSAKTDAVTGKWVIEPNNDLQQGENVLTLVAIEEFGKDANGAPIYREGKVSDSFIINVGMADFVTIVDALDDVGKWSGVLNNGALTDDTTPTLRGQANEGATVIVYYRKAGESTWAGSATATVNGQNWSWTPSPALAAGQYEFQAATPKVSSALFNLDIFAAGSGDQQTKITEVWDDFGTSIGKLNSGDYTDDMSPRFTGRAESNSRVVIQYTLNGSQNSVTVDVGHDGKWSWTPSVDLLAGDWNFQVKSEGAADWNDSFDLHIYPSPSVPTTITQVFDDVGVTGPVGNNGITDDSTPTLYGRSEAGRFVLIYDGNTLLGSTQTSSNGDWSFTPTALGDGRHNFWAVQRDYSGVSNKWQIEIDTSGLGPDKPSITGLFEHQASGAYDKFANGGIIDDGSVKVEGTGRALSVINIYDGTTLIGSTTAGTDGKWSYLHDSNYSSGFHSITAREVKSAGVSDPSNEARFTLVGTGKSGEGYYAQSFDNDQAVMTGSRSFSSGYTFRSINGATLKLVEGTLYSKNQAIVKKEPGYLKFLDDGDNAAKSVTFEIANSTDFYMAVNGLSDSGWARLAYYTSAGKYLGSSDFGSKVGVANEGVVKESGFVAPQGELIGKVTVTVKDKGGMGIASVIYGASSDFPGKGASYFNIPAGVAYSFTAGTGLDNFGVLTGVAYTENGKLKLSPDDIFSFTVGQTTDIQFSLEGYVDVTFYDAYNNVIHSGSYSSFVNYTAPAGQLIYRVAIDTYGQANVLIDNVVWGNNPGNPDYGYDSNSANIATHDDSKVELNGLVESKAIIDLQDGESTTKVITVEDLLTYGEEGLFTEDDTKQLMIQGDKNDVIQLKDIMPEGGDIEQWTHQKGTITVAGVKYEVYNHNGENAELLVQSDVKVEII
ncbi:Ig-like domain-containing protein [Pantoea sp. YR343]|nr:Ig-like domain-containing protein [Pantoea sp. YR343]KAJ9432571.1 Ig-like domain-containing protein [Pantoea sp. YR343]